MSADQYQLTHMQFELLSLWRGIEEQNLARIPDVEGKPDSTQGSEVGYSNERFKQRTGVGCNRSNRVPLLTASGRLLNALA